MTGEIVEIQIDHGTMGDGCGGEVDATIVTLWTSPSDGDRVVVAELSVAETAHSELEGLRDFLEPYLDGFGLGART